MGAATAEILEDLGYRVDSSVVPYTSFADDGGPDFRNYSFRPYWFGSKGKLLELPLTCGFVGAVATTGPSLYPALTGRLAMKLRAPGVLARLQLLERIRLTPEGVEFPALRRLTESLLRQGCRVFVFSYHSPSLALGKTPYVRDRRDLRNVLETIERYVAYFINDVRGKPTTPKELYDLLTSRTVETDSDDWKEGNNPADLSPIEIQKIGPQ